MHVAIYTREYFGIPVNFVCRTFRARERNSFLHNRSLLKHVCLRTNPRALSFEYRSPSIEGEVMNTNVTILPFNKIQNIFRNQAANS